jgi:hypothetical protein
MNKERYGIDSQTRNTVVTLMEQVLLVLQTFFALVTDAVGKKARANLSGVPESADPWS